MELSLSGRRQGAGLFDAPPEIAPQTLAVGLEAAALTCVRGSRTLFADLSLRIAPGQVVQIEGPNGCGKTSLLRLLCGLRRPDAGAVRWNGVDIRVAPWDFRAALVWIGHRAGVSGALAPLENLRVAAALAAPSGWMGASGAPAGGPPAGDDAPLHNALRRLALHGVARRPCDALSEGQRRRAGLARLPALGRRLWILDEPLTALDRDGVDAVERLCADHARGGGMVVASTHRPLRIAGATRLRLGGEA